jgi:hypothetical protein
MSKIGGQCMTPSPSLGEDENLLVDENASIVETCMTPTVKELMKKIEKINSELSKLKAKDKKDKKNTSASDDDDSSYEEEASNKAERDKKYIKKKKFIKGDKKLKTTTKRTCYNCGEHGHFIANCPFESRDDGDDKKKHKPYKKDKGYKRSDKPYKKKSYGETHIGQECESEDESSNSNSDSVATVAIKGKSSSSKSLFPKLN